METTDTVVVADKTIALAMECALAPSKISNGETSTEIEATTDWAGLLSAATAVPTTTLRPLDTPEARARYEPKRLLLLLDTLLDEEECARLNAAAEAIGYGCTSYPQEYRGNLRLIVTDVGLAKALWERVKPHVPEFLETADKPFCPAARWRAVGLNECFRLAKYYPGHRFGAHCDANFQRDRDERSFFTLNVYTNTVEPEHGGRTRFYVDKDERARRPEASKGTETKFDLQVQPVAGRAALFQHGPHVALLHDGERLEGGVKYLLRSDVMYRRVVDEVLVGLTSGC